MRSEDGLQRRERPPRGEQQAAGDGGMFALLQLGENFIEGSSGEAEGVGGAAGDDLLRLWEPLPFGGMVRLLRARDLRVRQLDALAHEDLRRPECAGDHDERRPAGVGSQPERHRHECSRGFHRFLPDPPGKRLHRNLFPSPLAALRTASSAKAS